MFVEMFISKGRILLSICLGVERPFVALNFNLIFLCVHEWLFQNMIYPFSCWFWFLCIVSLLGFRVYSRVIAHLKKTPTTKHLLWIYWCCCVKMNPTHLQTRHQIWKHCLHVFKNCLKHIHNEMFKTWLKYFPPYFF
jgi:hypothetical protein